MIANDGTVRFDPLYVDPRVPTMVDGDVEPELTPRERLAWEAMGSPDLTRGPAPHLDMRAGRAALTLPGEVQVMVREALAAAAEADRDAAADDYADERDPLMQRLAMLESVLDELSGGPNRFLYLPR